MAYGWVEKGILPIPGGWANQHAAFVDAIDVVRAQVRRVDEERARQQRDASNE